MQLHEAERKVAAEVMQRLTRRVKDRLAGKQGGQPVSDAQVAVTLLEGTRQCASTIASLHAQSIYRRMSAVLTSSSGLALATSGGSAEACHRRLRQREQARRPVHQLSGTGVRQSLLDGFRQRFRGAQRYMPCVCHQSR